LGLYCICWAIFVHIYSEYPAAGFFKGLRDADVLNSDADLLFGRPTMDVLQYGELGLGVACLCAVVEQARCVHLCVGLALQSHQFDVRVKGGELAILRWRHARGECEGVAFESQACALVNVLQALLSRFDIAD
jgi:hypothetical protein